MINNLNNDLAKAIKLLWNKINDYKTLNIPKTDVDVSFAIINLIQTVRLENYITSQNESKQNINPILDDTIIVNKTTQKLDWEQWADAIELCKEKTNTDDI